MYWTEAWVAILTAGLAYALWRLRGLKKELREGLDGHTYALQVQDKMIDGKADIRPTRPRACRVPTVFHDRDDQGREHWLCVKCGAAVPMKGHTVAACEEWRADVALAAKAGHEVATAGMEENQTTDLKS